MKPDTNNSTKKRHKYQDRPVPEDFSWYEYKSPYFSANIASLGTRMRVPAFIEGNGTSIKLIVAKAQKYGINYASYEIWTLSNSSSYLRAINFCVNILKTFEGQYFSPDFPIMIGKWIDAFYLNQIGQFKKSRKRIQELLREYDCPFDIYRNGFWDEALEREVLGGGEDA